MKMVMVGDAAAAVAVAVGESSDNGCPRCGCQIRPPLKLSLSHPGVTAEPSYTLQRFYMHRSSSDYAASFSAPKRNPVSSKSSGDLEEMRQLFKINRESLRQMTHRISHLRAACIHPHPNCNREFENSPELRRPRVHFAGIRFETCIFVMHSPPVADVSVGDGANIGWGQLQLLHATSQRVKSPQSPPEPLHLLQSEHGSEVSHFDQRPVTPTGAEAQRKYQRMLAVVEERLDADFASAEVSTYECNSEWQTSEKKKLTYSFNARSLRIESFSSSQSARRQFSCVKSRTPLFVFARYLTWVTGTCQRRL